MGTFGWSYPPGCSGPPDDDYDDTVCVFCGQTLPDEPHEDEWAFSGYCDAECAARQSLMKAKFDDDHLHATQRADMTRAIEELARSHREHTSKEKV